MIPFDKREFMKELDGGLFVLSLSGVFVADGWEFVTNGHALLRLRGVNSPVRENTPPVARLVDLARPEQRTVRMEQLCAWAKAGGSYRRACQYCESPQDKPREKRSLIGGLSINRCLLWEYLRHLPCAGVVQVAWGAPTEPLLVRTGDWELYVMPLGNLEEARFEFE